MLTQFNSIEQLDVTRTNLVLFLSYTKNSISILILKATSLSLLRRSNNVGFLDRRALASLFVLNLSKLVSVKNIQEYDCS